VIEADSRKIFVQVKKLNRQSRVSAEAVRTLANSVYAVSGAVGVMIATSSFTGAAQALAASTPVVLRTLDQVLAAKSVQDLLRTE
jgi:HJR/Mrr/RecB family endonuclease